MCCKGGWKQYIPGPLSRAGGLTFTSDPCWKKRQMTGLGLILLPSSLLHLKLSTKTTPTLPPPKLVPGEPTENREAQGFFSKLVVELGLEPTVLPTSHLTTGERLRLGCTEKSGRLVNCFTEAGVGPEISPEWNKGAVPDSTHQVKPWGLLAAFEPQPFRTGLQKTP